MKDLDIGALFKMFDNKENESQTTNITSLAAYQTLLDIKKNNNEKLKAEVERLKSERDTLLKECKKCGGKTQRKISKLQKQNLELLDMCAEQGEKAIKEFAEKLPELIPNIDDGETTMEAVKRAIKHLVTEMVGDDNA